MSFEERIVKSWAGVTLTLEREGGPLVDPSISLLSTVECVSTSALLLSWQGTMGMVERCSEVASCFWLDLVATVYVPAHKDVCTQTVRKQCPFLQSNIIIYGIAA